MKKILSVVFIFIFFSFPLVKAQEKNKGDFSNLVVFLRFADEDESVFEHPLSYYEQMFNDENEGANSVFNYFREASYNQLFWRSVFPLGSSSGGRIVSYQAQNERGYYRKYSSINEAGYVDDVLGANKLLREQNLIKELSDALSGLVPADALIDADGNGVVDNLCIIVSGRSEIGNTHLLWPHRSTLYTKEGFIREKRVYEYIMLFDDANGFGPMVTPLQINTGVLCHEMSHTLGTYDLYHGSVRTDLNPVGVWDLMSDNLTVPQQMSAYTKYKYCKWLDEIPEISVPGKYTLNPVSGTSKENVAYKIQPTGSNEYFVLEYRRTEDAGTFDRNLPGSGLLIYRVDPRYTGNNAYDGSSKYDELYLFRPGGTKSSDGNIEKAFFSQESGRTAFGGEAQYKPFYTNGEEARFAIGNISSCGETISFELLPFAAQIYLPQSSVQLPGNAGRTTQVAVEADIPWQILSLPDWLDVSPMQGEAGKSVIMLTTTSENVAAAARSAVVRIEGISDSEVTALLSVTQNSGSILPPSGLTAQWDGAAVQLTWAAPLSGLTVLCEDFESDSSASLWSIRKDSQNPAGWMRTLADKYTEAWNGNYAMRLSSDMYDMHQDEWCISPLFSGGASMSFYSKSLAPQKNNAHNFYQVLVSSDGGETWEEAYDLKVQSTVVNKYEKITVDLSASLSDNMKVAFRAWDDNNAGLSYWWIIDDVEIYPQADLSVVSGYEVFRNGIRIGTATECCFADNAPVAGENVYTVRALGDFGQTEESEPCLFQYVPSSLETAYGMPANVYYSVGSGLLKVTGKQAVQLAVFDTLASPVKLFSGNESGCFDINALPSGIYLVKVRYEDGTSSVVKIVK